jgi:hypothetical protein
LCSVESGRDDVKMMLSIVGAVSLIALGGCAANRTTSSNDRTAIPRIAVEEFTVSSVDAGIELYVRNKHPTDVRAYGGDRILLFVHGATYPGESTFDFPLNGISWMDYWVRTHRQALKAPR